jgi:hypothetical protein
MKNTAHPLEQRKSRMLTWTASQDTEQRKPCCVGGVQIGTASVDDSSAVSYNTKHVRPQHLAIVLLGN